MGNELVDFGGSHFARVALVVIQDVFPHPVDVGFLGARGVLFEADLVAKLVEQFSSLRG